jgi:RHS repeat-associated protein
MEYDSESQLYHTLFRYYNPRLGLWMTPDPAGLLAADGSNPQSLNR